MLKIGGRKSTQKIVRPKINFVAKNRAINSEITDFSLKNKGKKYRGKMKILISKNRARR